jgi:hypothetical protein
MLIPLAFLMAGSGLVRALATGFIYKLVTLSANENNNSNNIKKIDTIYIFYGFFGIIGGLSF